MQLFSLESVQMVVEKANWAGMTGYLGRAREEMARLEAYFGLFKTSNDWLERKCVEIETAIMEMSRNRLCIANGKLNYVSQKARRISLVMTNVDEIESMLKGERVQLILLPCLTEVYNRIFLLRNRTTMENMGISTIPILYSEKTIRTIDTTAVTDWRGFMVLCPEEEAGNDGYVRP